MADELWATHVKEALKYAYAIFLIIKLVKKTLTKLPAKRREKLWIVKVVRLSSGQSYITRTRQS